MGKATVELLNFVLSVTDTIYSNMLAFLLQSPESFSKNIWAIIKVIQSAMTGVGLGLMVLYFAIGVVNSAMGFKEFLRPESAVRLFVRFAVTKALVTYGMTLLGNAYAIGAGLVRTVLSSGGFDVSSPDIAMHTTVSTEISNAISKVSFPSNIVVVIVTVLAGLIIVVVSVTMLLTVITRFFNLYMYTVFSPIAISSLASESTASVGVTFLRGYAGICLQGAVVAVVLVMYKVTAGSGLLEFTFGDGGGGAMQMTYSYLLSLVISMLVFAGAVKGSDALIHKMLGL